eukprot:CAMPEP_0174831184 /NCGR_PEP_ID=MMETSP1114-20130205/2957_1 /TAXON_ID=312471 /ORGANISM="Neobodo designis, Strain CCAP 1951/1" /LENGTH=344 /DNA_ID=CAMNT_0016065005 /DNA_START=46 /DNA_END=1076 /DNA_ORIENTATION=+
MTSGTSTISLLVAEAVGTVEAALMAQQSMREERLERELKLAAERAQAEAERLAAEEAAEKARKEAEEAEAARAAAQGAEGEDSTPAKGDASPSPNAGSSPTTTGKGRSGSKGPAASSPSSKGNALFGPSPSPQRGDAKSKHHEGPPPAEAAFHGASERATKVLHRILVHTMHASDSMEVCRAPEFPALLDTIAELVGVGHDDEVMRQVGLDVNCALNILSVMANLCVYEDVREYYPAPALSVDIALACVRHQPTNRRVVHLCLMAISNVALCADLLLTAESVTALVGAVVPLHDEAPVVEAWACAMCNVAGTTADNLAHLVRAGAVAQLDTLLLHHGSNDRVRA